MTFAASREHNPEGHLIFPRDLKLRGEMGFLPPPGEVPHPAKANLHLIMDLVEHTTKPGQRVMDITAGSGTILVACKMDRKVVCIELQKEYVDWMRRSAQAMKLAEMDYLILQGDCREVLPVPCDAIIFSPPYSNLLNAAGGIIEREAKIKASLNQYSNDPKNLGNLPEFRFNYAMRTVYQKCQDSLPKGGLLTLLIKDIMHLGTVTPLGWQHVQMMGKDGWELAEWHKWAAPGMQFKAIHKAKGHEVIETEHIIIMRKK